MTYDYLMGLRPASGAGDRQQQPAARDAECSSHGSQERHLESCLRREELACPICMELLTDPFVTACGHTFCYACLARHLQSSSVCPSCSQHLTRDLAFPNHLLSKVTQRARATMLCEGATAYDAARAALAAGRHELSTADIDALGRQLAELRAAVAAQERESDLGRLLHFLQNSRSHKAQRLHELQRELACIEGDISRVEAQCGDPPSQPSEASGQPPGRRSMDSEAGPSAAAPRGVAMAPADPAPGAALAVAGSTAAGTASAIAGRQAGARASSSDLHGSAAVQDHASAVQTDQLLGKRQRADAQFEDLQDYYRRLRAKQLCEFDGHALPAEAAAAGFAGHELGVSAGVRTPLEVDEGLVQLGRTLSTLSRCTALEVLAEIPRPSLRAAAASIVSSLEFNHDGSLFATAGVSKRISVFEYAGVVAASEAGRSVHCPVVELVTRSKLSCLSWNRYLHSHVASSDYDGVVTLWDVTAASLLSEYEAHAKRIWSVDYCDADPALLASASDDCTVRVWSSRVAGALAALDLPANVCSARWRPGCSYTIAAGCADHAVYVYDLRAPGRPLHTLLGHGKAVAYVRWANERELVSASTDSTLRLWDLSAQQAAAAQGSDGDGDGWLNATRVFTGHANEKNFVGLAVAGDMLACGSETNDVCVYHSALSRPVARRAFQQPGDADAPAPGASDNGLADKTFISAVVWRPGSHALLAANSQGTVKVMALRGGGA